MLLSFVCLCVCLSRLLHTGIVGHERFVRRRLVLLAVLRHCLRLRLLQQGTDSDSRRWRRRADGEVVLVENQRLAADLKYGMACGGGADAGSVVFTIFPSLMQASMQCGGSFLLVLVSQMMLTLTFPSDRRKQTLKPVSFTRIVFWRTIDPGGTAGDGCGVGLAGASGSGFGASGADAGTGGAGFGLAVSVSTAGAEGSCKSRGAQVTCKGFGLYLLGFGISMLRKSMQYQSCPVTVALPGDTVVD